MCRFEGGDESLDNFVTAMTFAQRKAEAESKLSAERFIKKSKPETLPHLIRDLIGYCLIRFVRENSKLMELVGSEFSFRKMKEVLRNHEGISLDPIMMDLRNTFEAKWDAIPDPLVRERIRSILEKHAINQLLLTSAFNILPLQVTSAFLCLPFSTLIGLSNLATLSKILPHGEYERALGKLYTFRLVSDQLTFFWCDNCLQILSDTDIPIIASPPKDWG